MPPRLPFTVSLTAGEPIAEQVVFAVTRAIVNGQLRSGDLFPSVRTLGQELRINPNTAHRIVSTLTTEGLLVVRPGIGTVVGDIETPSPARRAAVSDQIERAVIEAKRAGFTLQQTVSLLRERWTQTTRRAG